TAYFAADQTAAAGLLKGTGFVPLPFAGRALVALHAAWNRHTSAGAYREAHLGIAVPGPGRPRLLDPFRGAALRRSGSFLVGSAPGASTVAGRRGPALPVGARDLAAYAAADGVALRSCVRTRGPVLLHPLPLLRLTAEPGSGHPLADQLRALRLDGARALLCLSSPARQTLRDAAVPLRPT